MLYKLFLLLIVLMGLSGCNDQNLQELKILKIKIEEQDKQIAKLQQALGQDNIDHVDVLTKNITLAENNLNNANVSINKVQDEANKQSKLFCQKNITIFNLIGIN